MKTDTDVLDGLAEGGEDGGGGAQEVIVGADVDFVDAFAAVSDKFHGNALADAARLQEGGGGGADAVEGFAVEPLAGACLLFSRDSDAVGAEQ